MNTIFDSDYWDKRYQQKETGWDIGNVSTPIKSYIDQLKDKNISILVPGCGNAYEAAYLLENNFSNVTIIDISPVLTRALSENLHEYEGRTLKIICGDFFDHKKHYDLVIEQTFFCALDPQFRKNYVLHMHSILKDEGKLVGLLFNIEFEGGPPFGGNEKKYREIFGGLFQINKMETAYNSIDPRSGNELWINLKKK